MHYYKKNIGDYAKKAGRLTMLQHGSYTLLLDACYDREKFPTLDEAIEWTWASTTEEVEAVTFVLKKFFVLEDGVYVQNRIREELENFHNNSETNKRIALEREAKRREKSTKRERVVHEPPPNQEPRTINQEPSKTSATKVACPPDVGQQVWEDWLQLRKTKKASVTETVVKGARSEAEKIGWTLEQFLVEWCTRGSQGLKAEWISDKPAPTADRFAGDI
jgi:uncharacterized protein YdaU (DUF1376 family)